MSAIPTWQAATVGQPGYAGAVNQFLGAHNATFGYGSGTVQASQTTGSGLYQSTASQWLAQQFTAGVSQTTIGQILLQVSAVGGSPTLPLIAPLTVSLYASSNGTPTGTAIASAQVNCEYVYGASFWLAVPLAATGLTPGATYQIVTSPVGSGSHYYAWQQSNQTVGASTSPDGVTWTTATYGLTYQAASLGTAGRLTSIIEDNGATWTTLTYNTLGEITTITTYTPGQSGSYLYTSRTLTYSGGLLTGVA